MESKYPLSVTSVVENDDGSLEVNCSGSFATTHLEGEDAHAFKLVADSTYRAQQEQQQGRARVLDLWRKRALG